MKRSYLPLSLAMLLGSQAYGAIDILTASVSILDADIPPGEDVRLEYRDDFSSSDLINEGSPSLLGWTSTAAFGSGGIGNSFVPGYMNDGEYATGDKKNTYFDPAHLPATVVYNLDTTTATQGYVVTNISTFMGWGFESRVHVHQDYKVEVSLVGSPDYVDLTDVLYTPFTDLNDFEGNYESKVTISEDTTGILASGVDSIRFTFNDTGGPQGGGGALGTVIREIDVVGFAVGSDPNSIVVTTPTDRQIIQRDGSNMADIPVGGTFIAVPDLVEARAVVRDGGENNGTSTGWQTIEAAPVGGTFSGALTGVAAGGWYEVEVRSVVGGTPSDPVKIGRVGVGDIYICAGQSNSANQGDPVGTPSSDRVSARDSASENSWVLGADPMPIAEGTGGSPWPRLGDLLVAEENVPIGFVSLGRNNSRVIDWNVGTANYGNLLKPAVRSFPQNGFKGFLWHQGEADFSTTAETYRNTLGGIINASRGSSEGANWNFPWYVAEASFQPSSQLNAEERVTAGQRKVAFSLGNVFLGSDTNDFHLEGRSWDGVHFNAAGLQEHARQWAEVLTGGGPTEVRNGNFELNTTTSLTGKSPLDKNEMEEVVPTAPNGEMLLDWRILKGNGEESADGVNGYFRPGLATYSASDKGPSLGNLSGFHVATLQEGSSNNYLLQTLRAFPKPDKTYLLSAAFGVRDVGVGSYGGARIELMNGSSQFKSMALNENALNIRAGGSASGKFTNVTMRYDTGALAGAVHELGIRIIKTGGGADSYLDVDNVILTELNTSSGYVTWLDSFSLDGDPNHDSDGDGLRNLVEYAIGTSPLETDYDSVLDEQVGGAFRVTRRQEGAGGLAYTVESSTNLVEWTPVPGVVTTVVTTDGDFETVDLSKPGGWVPSNGSIFYRLAIEIID